jgi:hypothetical protein
MFRSIVSWILTGDPTSWRKVPESFNWIGGASINPPTPEPVKPNPYALLNTIPYDRLADKEVPYDRLSN